MSRCRPLHGDTFGPPVPREPRTPVHENQKQILKIGYQFDGDSGGKESAPEGSSLDDSVDNRSDEVDSRE